MSPVIRARTPVFSSSSACEGVSKMTLAGKKAMGPIIRSYCCCRMLVDTSQSTWPDLSVMANASAMSVCIDAGIDGFLFAAPTYSSVAPLCSNSLAPSCVISAPDTNESTTLVGKRCSR